MTVGSTLEQRLGTGTPGRYLSFVLGPETYAIPVLKVVEIIRTLPITTVPRMPDYIKGVFNLRGKIVPAIDLRARFGLAEAAPTELSCLIVVQLDAVSGPKQRVGLMVDALEEVTPIAPGNIESSPDFGASVDTVFISGLAKVKGKVAILLDVDRVLPNPASLPMAKVTFVKT
ncbi:MAG: chemotaxis protein CheW [Candidatus Omnitrophica bacterium]|nr:chemotaxis protein CheW [Candidatus Omnitrophota bacterium]